MFSKDVKFDIDIMRNTTLLKGIIFVCIATVITTIILTRTLFGMKVKFMMHGMLYKPVLKLDGDASSQYKEDMLRFMTFVTKPRLLRQTPSLVTTSARINETVYVYRIGRDVEHVAASLIVPDQEKSGIFMSVFALADPVMLDVKSAQSLIASYFTSPISLLASRISCAQQNGATKCTAFTDLGWQYTLAVTVHSAMVVPTLPMPGKDEKSYVVVAACQIPNIIRTHVDGCRL